MGEAGPEARRGHHRRGARRRPALVVEFGEVGGEGLVVEPAAGEPGVEPAQSAGVRPARRVFGEMDAAARRRSVGGGRSSARRGGTGRGKGIHLHHRRRSIHVSPASETRTSKRLRPGLSWRSGLIQTMRASTRRVPRARGVFSGIRPMASSAIRNQTWSPAGPSSAPNQKVPFGSRVGSRAVRVLAASIYARRRIENCLTNGGESEGP